MTRDALMLLIPAYNVQSLTPNKSLDYSPQDFDAVIKRGLESELASVAVDRISIHLLLGKQLSVPDETLDLQPADARAADCPFGPPFVGGLQRRVR